MPVVVASSTRSAEALISYALDDKPDQQGERYVMASGVGGLLVSVAQHQMRDVRKKWGKDKPGAFVQAYHVIQSFAKDELDPEDPDAWMTAQDLGRALAEDRFPGRHVLVVTQRDGQAGCLHNHLVVNSVETRTGRSLNSSIVSHARLVEAHERVLEEQGFEQRADLKQAFSDATERRERGEPSSLRNARVSAVSELREFHNHILWEVDCDLAEEFGGTRKKQPFSLTVLKHRIEVTLADPAAVDWDSFVELGRTRGVRIEQRGKKGRGISYGMLREEPDGTLAEPSASDRRRCTTLGAQFEMDAVEAAFTRNLAARRTPSTSTPPRALTPKEHMVAALQEAAAEARVLALAAATEISSTADIAATAVDSAAVEGNRVAPSSPGTVDPRRSRDATRHQEIEPNPSPEKQSAEREHADHQPSPIGDAGTRDEANSALQPAGSKDAARKPLPLHLRFPELADSGQPLTRCPSDRSLGD